MYKKTITYTDYNDVERTEDFYFNLTKAELLEMQLTTEGGLVDRLKAIVQAQDTPTITKIFKRIITSAYGVKSPDGKRFIKNEEVVDEFLQTEAYSVLFMELTTDSNAAAEFVNNIIPKDIKISDDEVKKIIGTKSTDN